MTSISGEPLTAGSFWTLADQDFRDGLNYSHVKDIDLIVEIVSSDTQSVHLRHLVQGREEELPLQEFIGKYRPISVQESTKVSYWLESASATGSEFSGPWRVSICPLCGKQPETGLTHACENGRMVAREHFVSVTVVRKPE